MKQKITGEREGKGAKKKESELSLVNGEGVTHGSCHPSTSSFPCTSPNSPLVHRLHSAPLPAAPAAAGASARKTCSPLRLASVRQHRVKGYGKCCSHTLSYLTQLCEEIQNNDNPSSACSASLRELAPGHDTKIPAGGHTLTADTHLLRGGIEIIPVRSTASQTVIPTLTERQSKPGASL